MEKTLNVTPCSVAEALPYLAQVTRPKADTSGGLATVQDVCRHAQAFRVDCDGQTVGAYALEVLEFDRGDCLWVQAGAGQLDGVDLTTSMVQVVETQARGIGAKQIGMITRRRALVRKLAAQGWQIAGVKMVKKI
jgi:hypothetical protein